VAACHFFNTFFYAKLTERNAYDYSRVRRWTRRVDLFQCDKVTSPHTSTSPSPSPPLGLWESFPESNASH
jgi:hypothetical protein